MKLSDVKHIKFGVTVQRKAEIEVNKIYNDLKGNKLSLNINKTVFYCFYCKKYIYYTYLSS